MALSLEVTQGSKIKIGQHMLEVGEITKGTHITATYKGQTHLITTEERTELEDGVFVSCGSKPQKHHEKRTRLAFEAPRNVKINRQPV
jgi:hypothetical protein